MWDTYVAVETDHSFLSLFVHTLAPFRGKSLVNWDFYMQC